MNEIYVYGCGGVGKEIAAYLLSSEKYQLMGFIDDNSSIKTCMGVQCNTLAALINNKKKEEIRVVISIGEPFIREKVSKVLAVNGIKEVTLDIPNQLDSHYSFVDEGTLLHFNSYVSINSHIGKSCLINKYVLIGHDCTIGDYCVLSPKVTLGGNVTIGENTFIGTGALVRNGINIGKNVIVGMGAVVVKDVEDDAVVVGNPAKFIRKNESKRVFKNK